MDRYRERIRDLLAETEVDERRIAQEAALAADRSCIAEELNRLSTHRERLVALCGETGDFIGREADFLAQDQTLDAIQPFVADSGEGRWTALEAVEQGIPAPVMSLALMMRFASQGRNDFAAKMLAKMRQGFGGHAIKET